MENHSATQNSAPTWFEIEVSTLAKWDAQKAISLMQSLLEQCKPTELMFAIEATSAKISFVLNLPTSLPSLDNLQSIVEAIYPTARVGIYAAEYPTHYPVHCKYVLYAQSQKFPFYETIKTPIDLRSHDPLVALTQAMENLETDERIKFLIFYRSFITHDEKTIRFELTQSKAESGQRTPKYYRSKSMVDELAGAFVRGLLDGLTRVPRYDHADEERYRAKLSQNIYWVSLVAIFESPKPQRLQKISAISAAVNSANAPNVPLIEQGYIDTVTFSDAEDYNNNYPVTFVNARILSIAKEYTSRREFVPFFIELTAGELATLWHLPHDGFTAEKLNSVSADKRLPPSLRKIQGTLIGFNRSQGATYEVRLPYQNREMPTAIIGKPGRGKSSLMHTLIHDDIARGGGVCVIDPNGELVSGILQSSIPAHREKDVVVLDIKTKVDGVFYPPPMNLLGTSVEVAEDIATGRLITMFERLFTDFQGRKMADTLNMALMAVLSPQTTIIDLYNFLSSEEYRAQYLPKVSDRLVRDYWVDFEGKKGEKRTLAEAILWRLRSFYYNKYLRSITCQPRTLPLAEWVTQNRIILVSLGASENQFPEQERYILGSHIINQMDLVARDGVIGKTPFMLYVDEAQEFVRTALPNMLSQLRKYRLGIVLANQYYRQLLGDTYDALEGTVNTFIGFEVGERDADVLAGYMRPEFTKDDFTRLGKFRAGVSLVYNDARQRPFSMETLPPPGSGKSDAERETYLRRMSIANLKLKPYDEVLKQINDQYGADQTPPAEPTDFSDEDTTFEPRK